MTDIEPDPKVRAAMNEINAAVRFRSAALEKAEADKIMVVKKAEANAEAKFLEGTSLHASTKLNSNKYTVTHLCAGSVVNQEVLGYLLDQESACFAMRDLRCDMCKVAHGIWEEFMTDCDADNDNRCMSQS